MSGFITRHAFTQFWLVNGEPVFEKPTEDSELTFEEHEKGRIMHEGVDVVAKPLVQISDDPDVISANKNISIHFELIEKFASGDFVCFCKQLNEPFKWIECKYPHWDEEQNYSLFLLEDLPFVRKALLSGYLLKTRHGSGTSWHTTTIDVLFTSDLSSTRFALEFKEDSIPSINEAIEAGIISNDTKSITSSDTFREKIALVLAPIVEMLVDKNIKYGDSALNPKRIFSKADTIEQINVRIDDKLSRIANQKDGDDEDPELDLVGYLILKMIAKNALKG